jgi:hypothetical protein
MVWFLLVFQEGILWGLSSLIFPKIIYALPLSKLDVDSVWGWNSAEHWLVKVEILLFEEKLASLLMMYDLLCTVNFATRTQNDSCSAIDSIFMGNRKLKL